MKGYKFRGEKHFRAKLTDEQVRLARSKYKPYSYSYAMVARLLNCPVSTARDICTYRTRVDA